jgi:hypothetical protein
MGYSNLKVLSDFFNHVGFSRFIPAVMLPRYSDLVNDSEGYCMVRDDNQEFIFYRFTSEPFHLKNIELTPGYQAVWVQPYSGEKTAAKGLETGMAIPPSDWFWQDIPIVLYISEL